MRYINRRFTYLLTYLQSHTTALDAVVTSIRFDFDSTAAAIILREMSIGLVIIVHLSVMWSEIVGRIGQDNKTGMRHKNSSLVLVLHVWCSFVKHDLVTLVVIMILNDTTTFQVLFTHTPALQTGNHFLLTLETIVFLFHLLGATSKPFSSLSTRLAHAARLGFFLQKCAI